MDRGGNTGKPIKVDVNHLTRNFDVAEEAAASVQPAAQEPALAADHTTVATTTKANEPDHPSE